MNDEETDKKIEEFFFDPGKNWNEYRVLYSLNNPCEITRFSPLYFARRDIYYCFGVNPEIRNKINTGTDFGPAEFVAVWLMYQTVDTLAQSIKIKLEDFFRKYLRIKNSGNILALRQLRNAITHFKYSLRIRNNGQLWQFSLKPKSGYLIRKSRESGYTNNNFVINTYIFHERFELAVFKLKQQLLNRKNIELRKMFNKCIRRKHWVSVL